MKRPLIDAVLALCVLAVLAVAARQDLALTFQHTGRARLAAGDAVAAEAAFRRAGTLGGDAASLAYDLGVARYRQGDFAGAQRAFAAAMATSSPDALAAAQFNRANSGFVERHWTWVGRDMWHISRSHKIRAQLIFVNTRMPWQE